MNLDPQMVFLVLAAIFGPAGAAWVGVKTSINGMRDDLSEIKRDVRELRNAAQERDRRLSYLEGAGVSGE